MSQTSILIKPLGGIAGDMFVGACAALWPDLRSVCLSDLQAVGLPEGVTVAFEDVVVNGFASIHFAVGDQGGAVVPTGDYARIVGRLKDSTLDGRVLTVALEVLRLLGEAEARVHAKPLDDVHFHELADWDSVADIVAAASFIARSGTQRWFTGPLPMGGGTANTQHGIITVPAPAVLGLLEGYDFRDDGYSGERVTPTGAAILRYLTDPSASLDTGKLAGSGFGAGTKRFKGLANVVQLLAFEDAATRTDHVSGIEFDIDDMTPEELAVAMDRLRAAEGVLDVTQTPMIGKKGRAMFGIRVLCRPEAAETVQDLCLSETSTLGLRLSDITRRVLERTERSGAPRVKTASRPAGRTAKVESDDLAGTDTLVARRALARTAEQSALEAADE
ncbi:MAG: LarC family nickel insertion protein [Pseudomonadota bacterium]